jgi:hypothetical protein
MMSLSDEDCPFSEEERRAKASFIDVLSPNLSQFHPSRQNRLNIRANYQLSCFRPRNEQNSAHRMSKFTLVLPSEAIRDEHLAYPDQTPL